jgi:hypothetical protein
MEITKTNIENINNASVINDRSDKKNIFILSKVKRVKNWTNEEDELLMKMAEKYDFKNWNAVAEHLSGRSAIQCSARYKRIKPGIIKGAWTEEEDELLLDLLKRFGKNWSLISKYMPSRSGKQIRDRFLNALDPSILKDKFTPEEDEKILEMYAVLGSQWSKIALYLHRRTGDMIKNRFYSSLRRKIHNDDYREGLKLKKIKMMEGTEREKINESFHSINSVTIKDKLNSSLNLSENEIKEKIKIKKNEKTDKTHYNNNKNNFPLKKKTKRDVSNSIYNNSSLGPRQRIKLNKNFHSENKFDVEAQNQKLEYRSMSMNNSGSKVDRMDRDNLILNKINLVNSSNIKCQQADFIISKNESHNYQSNDYLVNSNIINKEKNYTNNQSNFNFSTIQNQSSSQVCNNKINNFNNFQNNQNNQNNFNNFNNFIQNNFLNNITAPQTFQNYLNKLSNQNGLNLSNNKNNNNDNLLLNNLQVANSQLNTSIFNANNINFSNYQNFNNLMNQKQDQNQVQGKIKPFLFIKLFKISIGTLLNMDILNNLSNPTNPTGNPQNIQNLNNHLQQSILNNLFLLKQEQNILNFNMVDYQMTQLINQLLQNNFVTQGRNTKNDLEGQLSTLKQLLDYTFVKLDYFKKNELIVPGGNLNKGASPFPNIKNEEVKNTQNPSLYQYQTTLSEMKTFSGEVPALLAKIESSENIKIEKNQE